MADHSGRRLPANHDLSRLLSLLEAKGIDVDRYWPLVELTVFAVQARYDADLLESDIPLDRVAVIDQVHDVLAAVAAGLVSATQMSPGRICHWDMPVRPVSRLLGCSHVADSGAGLMMGW